MDNNFEQAPPENEPPKSQEGKPHITDSKIVLILSNPNFSQEYKESILDKWRFDQSQKLFEQQIDDRDIFITTTKSEINLFKQAYEKIQNNEEKVKLKNFINERIYNFYVEAREHGYKDLDNIRDLYIK